MAAGNPAGLESVYRRYADRIYAYAKSIVGDDDTAADVIQETFLLAQQRVRDFFENGRHLGQLPAPGTLANHNSVETPALLPDGTQLNTRELTTKGSADE